MSEEKRILANRYEVGALIGRGGMADVYEGNDTRLGRKVAIKLLKSDLADDPSFESRFRQEAQASARMAHPTIVRIYDAGEEVTRDSNGNERRSPFIIMEFVKGTLLREILHDRRLVISEAVDYAEGVLTALEFSHRAGIVHRDIKAANVMITDSGQVKVMDFGIARTMSDSSATQAHTSGIVGTAQYFSPEQARGENVDHRSDLYSTGVLLYEMLAGRPPFQGETAVSVAYQHVSEAVTPPSQFNPDVSPEMDAVVIRALAKDREERFQSAQDFREHLKAAYIGSPKTTEVRPAVIPAPVEETVPLVNAIDPTQVAAEAHLEADAATELAQQVGSPNASAEKPGLDTGLLSLGLGEILGTGAAASAPGAGAIPPAGGAMPPGGAATQASNDATSVLPGKVDRDFDALMKDAHREATTVIPQPAPAARPSSAPAAPYSYPETGPIARKGAGVLWGVGSGVAVLFVGLLIWLITVGGSLLPNIPTPGSIQVANIAGATFEDGSATLEEQGLIVTRIYEPSDTVALDLVIRTDPPAGTPVAERTTVTVYVSSGKNLVKMPNLVGLSESEASSQLILIKLSLGSITVEDSATVGRGLVISSDPAAGTEIEEGGTVNLVISSGEVEVPDVTNLSISEAKRALEAPSVGFTVEIDTREECLGNLGTTVLEQSIAPGPAAQKSTVVLYVECLATPTPSP